MTYKLAKKTDKGTAYVADNGNMRIEMDDRTIRVFRSGDAWCAVCDNGVTSGTDETYIRYDFAASVDKKTAQNAAYGMSKRPLDEFENVVVGSSQL